MRFKHKQHDRTIVIFESEDWTSGVAPDVIAYFKTLPAGQKARYSPATKEWTVLNIHTKGMFNIINGYKPKEVKDEKTKLDRKEEVHYKNRLHSMRDKKFNSISGKGLEG